MAVEGPVPEVVLAQALLQQARCCCLGPASPAAARSRGCCCAETCPLPLLCRLPGALRQDSCLQLVHHLLRLPALGLLLAPSVVWSLEEAALGAGQVCLHLHSKCGLP